MDITPDMPTVRNRFNLYKTSSNCFLRWLWCEYHILDPQSAQGVKPFITTRKIIQVSSIVRDANRPVPGSVLGSLRDAIKHRKKAAELHTNLGGDDDGHRGFIKRLQQALKILKPLEVKDGEDGGIDGRPVRPTNQFAALMQDLVISSDTSPPRGPKGGVAAPTASTSSSSAGQDVQPAPDPPKEFTLEDDESGVAYDTASFLLDMRQLYVHLQDTWKDAGDGSIPLLVAAFQSNCVAYLISRRIPRVDCSALCIFTQHNCGCDQCNRIRSFLADMPNAEHPDVYVKLARRLWMIASVINDYGRELWDYETPEVEGYPVVCSVSDCPGQFHTPPSAEMPHLRNFLSTGDEQKIRDLMDDIRNHLEPDSRAISAMERMKGHHFDGGTNICEAFFQFGQSFLLQQDRIAHGEIVVAMGMFLLIEETKSPYDNLTGIACRGQALSFSMGLSEAIEPVRTPLKVFLPDNKTVCKSVELLYTASTSYNKESKSGIYHDSPWTNGCHMLEMLTASIGAGSYLCSYWAIIRTTLHFYNAMRKRGFDNYQIPRIPLLEELSEIFLQEAFRGTVPTRKFLTPFLMAVYNSHRVQGGRAFERGLQLLTTCDEETYWGICEQHVTCHNKNSKYLCKAYGTEMPLRVCECKNCDGTRAGKEQTNHDRIKKAVDLHCEDSLSGYATKNLAVVLAEIEGAAPIASINYFKLFKDLSTLLYGFGAAATPVVQPRYTKDGLWKFWMRFGVTVSRFVVEDLLEVLDTLPGNTKAEKERLAQETLFWNAVNCFREWKFRNATLKDYMWKF